MTSGLRFRRNTGQSSAITGGVACPCCGYATLDRRGAFDVCPICWWEDDGQDDHDAHQPSNGPNGDHTLVEARANFERHGDMYRHDASRIDVVANPTPERVALLRYLEAHAEGGPCEPTTLRSLIDTATAPQDD